MDNNNNNKGRGVARGSNLNEKDNDNTQTDTSKKKRKRQWRGTRKEQRIAKNKRQEAKDQIRNEVKQSSSKKQSTPTILFELSEDEYKKYKNTSIELTECYIEKGIKFKKFNCTYYKNVVIANDLQKNEHHKTHAIKYDTTNEEVSFDCFNLERLPNNAIFVLCNKTEVNTVNQNNFILTTACTLASTDTTFKGSGKVLLFIACKDREENEDNDQYISEKVWNQSTFKVVTDCKPNVVTKNNQHFESVGNIYSFGNKAFYGLVDNNSSISQYVNKKSKNPTKQDKINNNAITCEQLCCVQVEKAVNLMKRLFPRINKLISPLLDVAYSMQETKGDINLQKVDTAEHGIWQSELCVNAMTKIFHTEFDVTYTLISVPFQHDMSSELPKRKNTYFLLKINEQQTIGIELKDGVSFMFAGPCLTHRQFCADGYESNMMKDKKNKFFNIACYGNEKLFQHIKKSFGRLDK